MPEPSVETTPDGVFARCACGWVGELGDVEAWAVEVDRDRVVRRCPDCGDPRPEWGAFPGLDGVERVATGALREALVEAGVTDR